MDNHINVIVIHWLQFLDLLPISPALNFQPHRQPYLTLNLIWLPNTGE